MSVPAIYCQGCGKDWPFDDCQTYICTPCGRPYCSSCAPTHMKDGRCDTCHGKKRAPSTQRPPRTSTQEITLDLIHKVHQLKRAMKPVAKEIKDKLPTPSEQSYNPDFHVEITLTIAECRAILESLKK